MTKQEFGLFVMALKTYFPREKLLPNEQAVELWYRQLQDLDYKIAETALNEWVATEKWSPSIADIRELAARIRFGEVPDWGDGWRNTMKAIRMYGYYRPEEAMESLDDLTRETVKRLGFQNLCLSENQEADRANFRKIYEQLADRKIRDAQISEKLRDLIAGFRTETSLLGVSEEKAEG